MAQNPGNKLYHEHETNAEDFYKKYLSDEADQSTLKEFNLYPVERLHSLSDIIRGNSVIDISLGPNISLLLAITNLFNDITVLRSDTSSLKAVEKWMKNHPAAVNFSHVSNKVSDLRDNSDGAQEIETQLRSAIKQLLPCDFTKENITDPVVLEKADCVVSLGMLGTVSTDQTSYMNNMRKLAAMLKPGGRLVVFGGINYGLDNNFMCVGDIKYHHLKYDENTVRKVLTDAGCRVQSIDINECQIPDHMLRISHTFCALAVREDDYHIN
ncbi:nicotinamide N-methyltransferase-like [Pseudophryne corroboree]|uniref:nicotinamide N-methyltransferase-like n=1 Tax=Pseudophryne corroboree TaxID=495146 RepID=UPI0030813C21